MLQAIPPVLSLTALVSANPLLADPQTALAIGVVAGAAIGVLIGGLIASIRRQSKAGDTVGLMAAVGPTSLDVDADDARALAVLQAEHDRVRSEMAQRAQQIARLEAELRATETKSSRVSEELKARINAEKTGREAALAEAAKLKIELAQMQSLTAKIPGLEAKLARLSERS